MASTKRVALLVALIALPAVLAAIAVYTREYSNARLNSNTSESALLASNVQAGKFGYLGTYPTSYWSWTQPLIAPLSIGNAQNIMYATDWTNNVYAFDADRVGTSALWTTNLGSPMPSGTGGNLVWGLTYGCMPTPAIDSANGWIFVVCAVSTSNWQIAKLSMSTGSILASVNFSASATGTGSGLGTECTDGAGHVIFCFQNGYFARPALTVANGSLYVSIGQADYNTWHGWLERLSETDLSTQATWLSTPAGNGGGIWMSGGGPVIDSTTGNVFVLTGNGDYDGVSNFSMSLVKLSPALAVLDWFIPSNYAALNTVDADIGSGRPFNPPGTRLIVFGAKDWNIYSISMDCLGHLGGTQNGCTPQIFPTPNQGTAGASTGIFGGLMYMNGKGYFPTASGPVYAFSLSGSTWNTAAVASTSGSFNTHGLAMVGTANGSAGGVVWGMSPNAGNYSSAQLGALYAYDATTLTQLYSSATVPTDAPGYIPKFVSPTVANGKVYVPTSQGVAVYGLRGGTQASGNSKISGNTVVH